MTDHIAMHTAWQAAVLAIRMPPAGMRSPGNRVLLMSAEVSVRLRAFATPPVGPENAIALLCMISDFFEYANGELNPEEMEQANRAGERALAVLTRSRRLVA